MNQRGLTQYGLARGLRLASGDADWNTVTDTWHQSLDDAKARAEFEYEGITETWQSPT